MYNNEIIKSNKRILKSMGTGIINLNFWNSILGGAADKSGVLKIGDEIISVNNTDCTRMSRIEAWNFMKKLNDGTATIVVRQKIETSEATPKALEVKTNGNQDNVTTCEQKEKLEAKRWKKISGRKKNVAVIMNNFL